MGIPNVSFKQKKIGYLFYILRYRKTSHRVTWYIPPCGSLDLCIKAPNGTFLRSHIRYHGGTLNEFRIIVHGTLSQWFQLVTHGTLIEF